MSRIPTLAKAEDNAARISENIARLMPGLHFRLNHDDRLMMTTLEVRRTVEGWRYPIDDVMMSSNGAPSAILSRVLDEIRHKVTEDYGLTPYIEQLKEQAAKEAREAMGKAIAQFAEQFREKIPTIVEVFDEEDGEWYSEQSWVAGNLPPAVQAVVSRAQQLGGAR